MRHYLGLSHWEVEIIYAEEDVQEDDNNVIIAEVVRTPDRPFVRVVLYPAFFISPPYRQRHYLVHELLHLHVGRLWKHIPLMKDLIGALSYDLWSEAARSDMEEVVDALAYIVEPLVPLPSRHLVHSHSYDEATTEETGTKAS